MRVCVCLALAVMSVPCWAGPAANGMVILFTDYGADSIYVGALKGAVYSKFPEAKIDAITNSAPVFDVAAGAEMLAEACGEFPPGTTFCCVIDPGVGTARRRIALETKNGYRFVGPDNGLFTLVVERFGVVEAREAANRALWRAGEPSSTFQGRDVFGPVAAAVASGVPLSEVGPEAKDLATVRIPTSAVEGDAVRGEVVRGDWYGNLVTCITLEDLGKIGLHRDDMVEVTIGKARFTAPLKQTYADVPEGSELLVVQSVGRIECAIDKGNLAEKIGEGVHAQVTMKKPSSPK